MRKYVVGALFGFLLSFAISAHAEITSMIGKVVDGSFPLQINGQKADKDAITIEGTSYIPVRAAGELFGYDVSFIDSQVILKKKGDSKLTTQQNSDSTPPEGMPSKDQIKAQLDKDRMELKEKLKSEEEAEEQRKQKAQEDAQRQAEELRKLQEQQQQK